ncbi:uncharacterized protein LOC129746050 isoform X2 [Uranotaenia lowii]|uniref:uncharacterized protein LOC129746050 isoform X2 n=1 Tax=Uranotaenia lowii TaxID=190385 RepID=UPI0024785502|nr:uncharacterized protein LOC129746050 isoform X2 [Uranotaenia lowii]
MNPAVPARIVFLFCLVVFSAQSSDGANIFPSDKLSITEGAGFLAYLVPTELSEANRWIHCSVRVAGVNYSLDSDQIHTLDGVTEVQRFSAEICGIRVQNVRKSLETTWSLLALDSNSSPIEQSLSLTVINSKPISSINVTVSDTTSTFTLTCPDEPPSSRRFCRILDEQNHIFDGCSKSFDITWEEARFRCLSLYWGDMEEIEIIINVKVQKSQRDVSWFVEEDESHVVLSCHYRTAVSPCRAVSVSDSRQMMLLDGHLGDRYSAYDTKISGGICSLEIRKPLTSADRGLWRIFMPLNVDDYTGCVFNLAPEQPLDDDSEHFPEIRIKTKLIEVFHDKQRPTTTTTELNCEAPYPIDYCYLTGPQGGDFSPTRFDRTKTFGVCRFVVQNITTGRWSCGFNGLNGLEDRLSYFDVKVYDQPGRAIVSQIKASKGDENRRMMCTTILNMQVDLCRFVSPIGEVHGLSENIVPTEGSRFRYHGNGLRTGECGLEISKLIHEDFGQWKCAIKVKGRDYTIPIDLIEEGEL